MTLWTLWWACALSPVPGSRDLPSAAASVTVEAVRPMQIPQRIGATEQPMVITFWATWCGPCVSEQPRLYDWAQAHPEVRTIWVSLDLIRLRTSLVTPHLEERGYLRGAVEQWQLEDADPAMAMSRWLPDWQGILPTTVVVSRDGQVLETYPRALSEADLEEIAQRTQR